MMRSSLSSLIHISRAAQASSRKCIHAAAIRRRYKPQNQNQNPRLQQFKSFSFVPNDDDNDNDNDDNDDKARVKIHHLHQGIKHVELNRPGKLNSLDMKMFHAIANAAQQLRDGNYVNEGGTENVSIDKDDTKAAMTAVILSGRGRAFCTGLDVQSMIRPDIGGVLPLPSSKINRLLERPSGYQRQQQKQQHQQENAEKGWDHQKNCIHDLFVEDDIKAVGNLAQDIAYIWRDIPVPVIAVLGGMCFGGGLQLALGADMRYATPDCRLSIMESKWGLIPDMSATITLRELVSIDVAKELTYTGKIIDGIEAQKIGLVTRCHEDPMKEAIAVAEVIATRSPDAVAAAKVLYQRTWVDKNEKESLELETDIQKRLLPSWNQLVAAGKNFGIDLPYKGRKDF
mmetsp:Transcript_11359/g.16578  ORF Transcript_11359/g.16578 Transcript_11359/m.16578 type:complete len:399 (-) Transcript_11359:198-1394(-)